MKNIRKNMQRLLLLGALLCLSGCATDISATSPETTEAPVAATFTPQPTATPAPTPSPTPEPTPMVAKLLACGDVVPHFEILEPARSGESYNLAPQFGDTAETVSVADYAFCTVEAAMTGKPYSYYPAFRAPDDVAVSLQNVGYDMICCASNHCVDGGFTGIVATLDLLDRLGLDHVGTYRTEEEWAQSRGVFFKEINGIRIAFLDYTSATNQNRLYANGQDAPWAVNTLFREYYYPSPFNPRYEELALDVQAARDGGADVILAVCHWGEEFHTEPVAYQYEMGDFLLQQGVDIIIGSHPHIPEPIVSRTVQRADGSEYTGYICYSLGNLHSYMLNWAGDVTPFVNITLEKNPLSGKTEITDFSYTPVYRAIMGNYGQPGFRLIDMDAAIQAWQAGTSPEYMTERLYTDLLKARSDCLSICGEEFYAGA